MVVRPHQSHIPTQHTPAISTWDEVQEFGGEPFQTTIKHSSSSHSLSSNYDMVSRSEVTPTSPLLTNLSTLPAELLLLIAQHLQYPDLLALRHTHPRFLNTKLLATSNRIHKVEWLVDRYARGLVIPMHKGLRLDSDAAFCSQAEVREIMQRRLRHGECKAGPAGCILVEGRECGGAKRDGRRMENPGGLWRRRGLMGNWGGRMIWVGVLVAVVAVMVMGVRRYLEET